MKAIKVHPEKPSVWTHSLEVYLRHVFAETDKEKFKSKIMEKDQIADSRFRLYCERSLMDL